MQRLILALPSDFGPEAPLYSNKVRTNLADPLHAPLRHWQQLSSEIFSVNVDKFSLSLRGAAQKVPLTNLGFCPNQGEGSCFNDLDLLDYY